MVDVVHITVCRNNPKHGYIEQRKVISYNEFELRKNKEYELWSIIKNMHHDLNSLETKLDNKIKHFPFVTQKVSDTLCFQK